MSMIKVWSSSAATGKLKFTFSGTREGSDRTLSPSMAVTRLMMSSCTPSFLNRVSMSLTTDFAVFLLTFWTIGLVGRVVLCSGPTLARTRNLPSGSKWRKTSWNCTTTMFSTGLSLNGTMWEYDTSICKMPPSPSFRLGSWTCNSFPLRACASEMVNSPTVPRKSSAVSWSSSHTDTDSFCIGSKTTKVSSWGKFPMGAFHVWSPIANLT
mmetsp:Transcript_86114/g.228911  ORF Transcript_86114/g.228911 Transcript_86114/m.228911 type:complete len:210 (+) Transcript_86114:393-1022(+)